MKSQRTHRTIKAGRDSPTVGIELEIYLEKPLQRPETIYIAGNLSALGDWNPDKVPVRLISPKRLYYAFNAPKGAFIEFKLTRGSWKSQGIYEEENPQFPPNNRVFQANADRRMVVKVTDWLDRLDVNVDPVQGELIAHENFKCPGLRYDRDLFVWLPPAYRGSRKRFPVLYMHDGQNLFDPGSSFCGQDWKVDETATRLISSEATHEFIVVGIANSPDRMQEYNLFHDRGKAYAKVLIEKVKPYIDAAYRTKPGPEDTGIMGSSMGGLISFQIAWNHPNVFSMAGCLSSAFYIARSRLFREVRADASPRKPVRFYIDTGEFEPPIVKSFHRMAEILRSLGYEEGGNFLSYHADGANHSEAAWAERLHIPLEFFFGKFPPKIIS